MNKKLEVSGMHCKACELLIENNLNEINGVKVKNISSKTGELNLEIKDENTLKKVEEKIEELGYSTSGKKNIAKNTIFDYIILFLIFIIVGIIIFLLKDINLFGDALNVEDYGLFLIILTGIVASMSSCLAITGGIILGFSKYVDSSKGIKSHIKMQSMFHIGRIVGFFIFGGILGQVGSFIGGFGSLNKILLLIAGILMIYMGLNMVNIVPSITKLGISMPKSLGNKILNIKNPLFTPIVGALTFFLPCGFTQSMQVLAASSGSFFAGAIIMTAFAIGTFPVLFLVGVGNSYFKDKNFSYINKIIGVIVIYFGIFILSGFSNMIAFDSGNKVQTEEIQPALDNTKLYNTKEVYISHNGNNLEPENIILEGSNNYKLIINPTSNGLGCKYALTIPGIDNSEYMIKKGVPITININDVKPGTYKVVCTAMGMLHGTITIK